jgi:hypothetical protein
MTLSVYISPLSYAQPSKSTSLREAMQSPPRSSYHRTLIEVLKTGANSTRKVLDRGLTTYEELHDSPIIMEIKDPAEEIIKHEYLIC